MSAEIRRIGAHVGAVCEDCPSRTGHRYWQHWYPTRTIEGYALAERDRDEHNRVHHPIRESGEGDR